MEKYVLVEYVSSLNAVLNETFKSTQRIKLTSFDVSSNYILFGASSGGIYVFKRSPYEFIKIIPSKEGSTLQVKVSPDERTLAIANAKGLVFILEDFFVDLNLRPLIHSEHEGNIVTVLEWYENDLYCGDNIGKVSIFTLTSVLTKAIFQTPAAVLMHLDSSIIQIGVYLNYLLISTKTRTYLCDTVKEQYKQIGKKLRDGNFGACFCEISNRTVTNTFHQTRGAFNTVQDGENFSSSLENNDTKIFCARPGARLWEANFEAFVLVTYQFRNSLNQNICDMLLIEDNIDARLNIYSCSGTESITKHFNFGKIYPICKRFIFTYDAEGIYFFDPVTSTLVLWNSSFKNVLDVKISNNCIFIWRRNLQMNIISVKLLEDIIINTLLRKQYYLCAEICLQYINDLFTLIDIESKNINLVLILKDKLAELNASELLEKMNPVFSALDNIYKEYTLVRRLENGMTIIDNRLAAVVEEESDSFIPESIQNFKANGVGIEEKKNSKGSLSKFEENTKLIALYKQFILNKSHKGAELTECSKLLETMGLEDMLLLLEDFIKYVQENDSDDATNWCQGQIIKRASKDSCNIGKLDAKTTTFLVQSYLKMYSKRDLSCKCNFPLPKAHLQMLEHYNLATQLFDHLDKKCDYLDNIPYLYKHYLRKQVNSLQDVTTNLPAIIQFSDQAMLQEFINNFTYDTWDELIKLFIKLKQGICLNCGESIDTEGILTWTELGLIMIKSIGPNNSSRILKRYSKFISNGDLDSRFYQSCIMGMVYEDQNLAVNFMEKCVNPDNLQKFQELLGKFLQKKYLGTDTEMILKEKFETKKCSICGLPIHGLILNDFKKCDCGIYFHNICFNTTNRICRNCIANSTFLK